MKIQYLCFIIFCLFTLTCRNTFAQSSLTDSSKNKVITFLKSYESSFNKSIIGSEGNIPNINTYFHSPNSLIFNQLNKSDSLRGQNYLQVDDLLFLYKNVLKQNFSYQLDFSNILIKNNNVILSSKENHTETVFFNVILPVNIQSAIDKISIKDTLNFYLNYMQNTQNQAIKIDIAQITKADYKQSIPIKSLPQPYIERLIIKQKIDSLMNTLNDLVLHKEDTVTQSRFLSNISTLIEPSGYFHILSQGDSIETKVDARTFIKNTKNFATYTFLKAKINHNQKDVQSKGICINTYHNVFFKDELMYFDKRTGLILYDKNVQTTKSGWWIYEVWLKE